MRLDGINYQIAVTQATALNANDVSLQNQQTAAKPKAGFATAALSQSASAAMDGILKSGSTATQRESSLVTLAKLLGAMLDKSGETAPIEVPPIIILDHEDEHAKH